MKEIAGCKIYKEEKILLLHRIDKNHWELPGGKIKEGETPEQTTKREAKEEIGCEIEILNFLKVMDFKINNETIKSHQFSAKIVKGTPFIKEKNVFDKIDYIDINKEKKLAPNLK
jgi:8-oxo-dGTP diphosphatase